MKVDQHKVEILLAEKKLSMGDLARRMKVSAPRVRQILIAPQVRPETAGRLAKALRVGVESIVVAT